MGNVKTISYFGKTKFECLLYFVVAKYGKKLISLWSIFFFFYSVQQLYVIDRMFNQENNNLLKYKVAICLYYNECIRMCEVL